jgi:hypothetical protein
MKYVQTSIPKLHNLTGLKPNKQLFYTEYYEHSETIISRAAIKQQRI